MKLMLVSKHLGIILVHKLGILTSIYHIEVNMLGKNYSSLTVMPILLKFEDVTEGENFELQVLPMVSFLFHCPKEQLICFFVLVFFFDESIIHPSSFLTMY